MKHHLTRAAHFWRTKGPSAIGLFTAVSLGLAVGLTLNVIVHNPDVPVYVVKPIRVPIRALADSVTIEVPDTPKISNARAVPISGPPEPSPIIVPVTPMTYPPPKPELYQNKPKPEPTKPTPRTKGVATKSPQTHNASRQRRWTYDWED